MRQRFASGVVIAAITVLGSACSKDPEVAKREYLESGDRFLAEAKYGEAVIQYQNALQQDAKFGEARFKLAEAYAKVGNLSGAAREYVRAADLLPDRIDAQLKAATYLLLARQFEDAKTRANNVIAKDPKNTQAIIIRATAMAGLKEFSEALDQLKAANDLEPTAAAFARRGTIRLATGETAAAEAEFRNAIANEPRNVNAHLALANYLMATGRISEAEGALKAALALEPSNVLAHRGLATFYVGARRWPEAEPHVKSLAEGDTSPDAPYKLALADFYVASGRPAEALKVLEPLISARATASAAKGRIAVLQFSSDRAKARATLDEALTGDPKNALLLLTKARFHILEGQLDSAMSQIDAAVAADPKSIDARYLAGVVQERLNRPDDAIASFNEVLKLNPQATVAQLQLSRLNQLKGRTGESLQFAEAAAHDAPGSAVVQLSLARSLMATGDVARADAIVKALVAKYPQSAITHATAGTLNLARKDLVAARRAYERALSLDAGNLEALTGLGGIDVAERKGAAAVARATALLAKFPDDPNAQILAARSYASTGDLAKAEEILKSLIARHPSNVQAYGLLAQAYLGQRKLNQARTEFERIVEQDPKSISARTMAAMILSAQGSRPEARRRYEEILQIDSRAAVASNNLAYIYADDGGNLDVALQLAQTAVGQLPDSAEVADTLGYVYLKKGLASLAVSHLEASVAKEPNQPIYRYHLGLAYAALGDDAKARAALTGALSMSQSFSGAQDARRALAALK